MAELTAELLVDRLDPRDIVVSPDGRLVAFSVRPVGRREEHAQSAIWLARADEEQSARRFTSGEAEDKSPRFAGDGAPLFFLSDRTERGVAQLHRIRLDGGEAEELTEGKPGVAAYAPLADGARVALLSSDPPSEDDERREQERDDPNVYGDWRPQRLRVLELETKDVRRLEAPGERHVRAVVPAPEGSLAAVVLWETPELDNVALAAELAVVDLDGDEIVARWPLVAGEASVGWTADRELCVLAPIDGGGQAGFGVFLAGFDEAALRLVTDELAADPIALAVDGAPVLAVAEGLDSYLAR